MNHNDKENQNQQVDERKAPRHVRLPGFVLDEEIGLGDVIKRVTYAVGIRPCGSCEQRAGRLNQWMVFTR
jgi:hypothetical protein